MWNFSKISSSQHYPYSLPFFQIYYKRPFDSPFFYHLPRLIIHFLLKKVVGRSILKIWIENYLPKIEPQLIRICFFKEKERERGEGRLQLGGQWKVPMFGGPWNVPMLSGQWKEKEKHLFTSSHFPLTNFT